MTGTMKYILFYDGGCRFCNRWVQWVVDRDVEKVFRFASLESVFFKDLQAYLNIKIDVDSIVIVDTKDLFENKRSTKLIYRSEAVECLFANLEHNAFVYNVLQVVPRFISDFLYRCLARIRKLLPVAVCRLYTKEEKKLFLNEIDFSDFISLSL